MVRISENLTQQQINNSPIGEPTEMDNIIENNIYLKNYAIEIDESAIEFKKKILGIQNINDTENISNSLTLIRNDGLTNIENLLRIVEFEGVVGDFVETGVWKGGAVIFAKYIINKLGLNSKVYVCDSFRGLPKPNPKYTADKGDIHHTVSHLNIPKSVVEDNFKRYDLLDDNVVFVEGWFSDTMPELKKQIDKISILRLDGDMYESTIVVLENLYDLVSDGGYIIIDDFSLDGARQATIDFRAKYDITSPLIKVNHTIFYWKK